MKKIVLFLFLFLYVISSFANERLFFNNPSSNVIATKDKNKTINLSLNNELFEDIVNSKYQNFDIVLPFYNDELVLNLKKFDVYTSNLKIVSKTQDGDEWLEIEPSLLTYKIFIEDQVLGVINFVNGEVTSTFRLNGAQYEIARYGQTYVLFEASNSINNSNFSCASRDGSRNLTTSPQFNQLPPTNVCIELAIEIDYYTRQTFASDQEATNWALAIIAGVSQVYESETNAAIQVVHTEIWNVADPYDTPALNGQASQMLSEVRSYWNANNGAIARDLVHLMTKRSNTGTGGIAYLDVLCSNSSGYGFSGYLTNDTTFNFPNPSYTWNLMVVSHEIGHNVGSRHTFWCGWAADPAIPFVGGPIDNCVDVEGSCPNNPQPVVGTIMSYCHTVSTGSLIDFHPVVVSQALDVGIANASCLTTCDYYGCTDPTAFNYDPAATVDDGSCIAIIYGCIDGGSTDYTSVPPTFLTAGDGPDGIIAANYDPLANTDDGSCTYCASLDFTTSDISCAGASDGLIEVLVSGSSGTSFTYYWTGPNSFDSTTFVNNISNLTYEGSYTVVVEDNLNCRDTASIYLNEPGQLSIDNITSTPVSCYSYTDGSVSININGGTPPFIFHSLADEWSTQQCYIGWDGIDPVNTSWAYKDFVIPDGYKLDSVYFDAVRPGYPLDQHDFVLEFCSTSFTYNPATAIAPISYTSITTSMYNVWIDLTNLMTPAGQYYNIEDSTTVRVSLPIGAGASWNNLCFAISPNNFFDNFTSLTYLSPSNYSPIITDYNNCPAVLATFTITEPLPITSNAVVNDISCYNYYDGNISLTPNGGTGPFIYSWTGPNGYTSSFEDITGLFDGFYQLNMVDYRGCVFDTGFTIINPPVLDTVSVVKTDVNCNGGTNGSILINATGGMPGYYYAWSNGDTTSQASNIAAGNYFVTVSDENGCSLPTMYFTIFQPLPSNLVSSVSDVDCFGNATGSIDIMYTTNSSFTITDFDWQGPNGFVSSQEDINNLPQGVYLLTVTENNHCQSTFSIPVIEPNAIEVIEQVQGVACLDGSDGIANLSISGGTPVYVVDWNGYNSQALEGGIYFYTITDDNSCVYIDSVVVQEPLTSISVIDSLNNVSCFNAMDGTAELFISGGLPPYVQSWPNANPLQLQAGYSVYEILDSNNCLLVDSVFLDQPDPLNVVEQVTDAICNSTASGTALIQVSGGTFPYAYLWSNMDTTQFVNNLLAGSYLYFVYDKNGCQYQGVVSVGEPSPMSVQNIITPSSCIDTNDGSVDVIISGGVPPYNQNWHGVDSSALSAGSYDYIVIDSVGCIDSNQVLVYSSSNIQVVESVVDVDCFGDCNGNINLVINNGAPPYLVEIFDISGNIRYSNQLCAGLYDYSIVDNLGCVYKDSFSVYQPDELMLDLFLGTTNLLQAVASGGTSPYAFQWWDDNGFSSNLQNVIVSPGIYYCIAYDDNNCHSQVDTIEYIIQSDEFYSSQSISVYPNPTQDKLFISDLSYYKEITFSMTDVLGKNVPVSPLGDNGHYVLDCSVFSKGVYLLSLELDNKAYFYKIVIE